MPHDAHLVFRSLEVAKATELSDALESDSVLEDVEVVMHDEEPGAWYVYATASDIPSDNPEEAMQFCKARWSGLQCENMWVMVVDA